MVGSNYVQDVRPGAAAADRIKLVFRVNVSAMVFGLGYIVASSTPRSSLRVRSSPGLCWSLSLRRSATPSRPPWGFSDKAHCGDERRRNIQELRPPDRDRGIAMAGLIGIIRSSRVIGGAFSLAYREIAHKKRPALLRRPDADGHQHALQHPPDTPHRPPHLRLLLRRVVFNLAHAVAGLLIVVIVSFLFTTVAANATAIVGRTRSPG